MGPTSPGPPWRGSLTDLGLIDESSPLPVVRAGRRKAVLCRRPPPLRIVACDRVGEDAILLRGVQPERDIPLA